MSIVINDGIFSHIEEIDDLILQFSICVWVMIFDRTGKFPIFVLFQRRGSSKLLFYDEFVLIWKIVDNFINLVGDGIFKLIEVQLVGGKMFSNKFWIGFLWEFYEVINCKGLLKVSVLIEENILIRHFRMSDVIFLLNYIEIVTISILHFHFLPLSYFHIFSHLKHKYLSFYLSKRLLINFLSINLDFRLFCKKKILVMMMVVQIKEWMFMN